MSSLPLHQNHSYQASESALCLFCTTWSTWNNRKRLNLTQSSILVRRFPCSCRRSFLSSLLLSFKLQFNRLHSLTWILSIKMQTFEARGGEGANAPHAPPLVTGLAFVETPLSQKYGIAYSKFSTYSNSI